MQVDEENEECMEAEDPDAAARRRTLDLLRTDKEIKEIDALLAKKMSEPPLSTAEEQRLAALCNRYKKESERSMLFALHKKSRVHTLVGEEKKTYDKLKNKM